MSQTHPSGMFSYITKVENAAGLAYYHCVLLRDLPYDTTATARDPVGVTFHNDQRCLRGREFSLIKEIHEPTPHFYGWETDDSTLCLDVIVAY